MMLEFKNVSFRYAVDEFPMMENLSFSVEEGDFVSIIGASGCGKSTIFRLINGLEQLQKAGVPAAEQAKRCRDVLTQVGLLEYMKKYPKDLSGGMKQRVSFARTLLSGADMLLLDEPFSALDYLTRVEMQEWLLEQWEHYHKTILFITHDVEEAVFLSKKIFVIQDRPFSSMEMVEVPLPAHRDRNDLKKPEIVDLKERLIGKLRRSVRL